MNVIKKTWKSLRMTIPILLGVLLLIALLQTLFSNEQLSLLFRGDLLPDAFIGASLG